MKPHRVPRSLVCTGELKDGPFVLPRLDSGSGPAIPAGLGGSVYVITAAGFDGKPVERGGDPCINGDGRVYRISFDDGSGAGPDVNAAYVDDPSRIAARMAADDPAVTPFYSFGISRISPSAGSSKGLGVQNLANTALVPIQFEEDQKTITVLLATYDAGRPVALDPKTLETIGAIGAIGRGLHPKPGDEVDAWRGQLFDGRPFPFYGATAHPAWSGEALYAVNFGRPLRRLAALALRDANHKKRREEGSEQHPLEFFAMSERLFGDGPGDGGPWLELPQLEHPGDSADGARHQRRAGAVRLDLRWSSDEDGAKQSSFTTDFSVPRARMLFSDDMLSRLGLAVDVTKAPHGHLSDRPTRLIDKILAGVRILFRELVGETSDGFTRIVRWTPKDGFRSFELVERATNGPVQIMRSAHQVAETEHWVILADTAFKFDFDIVMPEKLPDGTMMSKEDKAWIHRILSRKQAPPTPLYFVAKSDLDAADASKPIAARRVDLDAEVVHFFADRDDDGGRRVRLWVIDQCATDTAEFVHSTDRDHADRTFDDPKLAADGLGRDAVGMFTAGYEVNSVVCYDVDPIAGTAQMTDQFDDDRSWMVGLPAAPDVLTGVDAGPRKIERFFVYSIGFAPEVVTRLTYRLYRDPERRAGGPRRGRGRRPTRLDRIRELTCGGGQPGALYALRRDENGQIHREGRFEAPPGVVLLTPQFVPNADPSQPAFLVVPVYRAGPVEAGESERELWVF
ncbi:MAG: carotenoid oxygenase family protein, partial [Sandaracinaceae bacterium]